MKFAVIGYGSAGKRHLTNLLELGADCSVVSSHLDVDLLEIAGKKVTVVNSIEHLIDKVDAVIISNITSLHLKCLQYLINHNKHVYVEKPISCRAEGLDGLVQQVIDKGLVVMVGTQFRFNQRLIRLKQLIDERYFGEILAVFSSHGEFIGNYHPEEDYRASYSVDPDCGGVLLTQIHHIDYLNWMLGPFHYAYANMVNYSGLDIDCDAVVNYSLVKENSRLQVHGHMNYIQQPKSTWLRLIGEHGTAFWDYENNILEVEAARGNISETGKLERNDMFMAAMSNYIELVSSRTTNTDSLASGIESVQIVDAIRRSAANREIILI